MLLDSRSLARPYIVSKRVETIVREHTSGTGNYTTEIHKLLTLELLHRLFFDRSYFFCCVVKFGRHPTPPFIATIAFTIGILGLFVLDRDRSVRAAIVF